MTCLTLLVSFKLGNHCTKTHKVTICITERPFDHLIFKISHLFNIPSNVLKISYYDQHAGAVKILDESLFHQNFVNNKNADIPEMNIVGVHFENLETVEDFCSSVSNLTRFVNESATLLSHQFDSDAAAEEFDDIILGYRKMIEFGMHPWQSIRCQNNREFFYLQGMAEEFIATAKELRVCHLHWKNILTLKTRKFKALRLLTLNLLWTFLAKKEDRIHWFNHGALDLAIDSFFDIDLLLDAHDSIKELSMGIIVQFTEIDEAKSSLINDEKFMKKFCYEVMIDARCLASHNDDIAYRGQTSLNTLMCFISSSESHQIFLDNNIIAMLCQLAPLVANDVASCYFFSLCVTFLIGFSLDKIITKSASHSIDSNKGTIICNSMCELQYLSSVVFNFWQRFTPSNQHRFEVEKHFIWITMKPYVELAWCYSQPPCIESLLNNDVSAPYISTKGKNCITNLMGFWALDSMMRSNENLRIMHDEGLTDFVTMISWHCPLFTLYRPVDCVCGEDQCSNYITELLPQPPSLQNICRAKLIRFWSLKPHVGIHGTISAVMNEFPNN